MSAEIERALLVLLRATTDEIDLHQFGAGPRVEDVERTTPTDALIALAAGMTSGRDIDRFAAAQGLILGLGLGLDEAERDDPLRVLGGTLLASVGAEPTRSAALLEGLRSFSRDQAVSEADDLVVFEAAFGGRLAIADANAEQLAFRGPGAFLAAMLLELVSLFAGPPKCVSAPVPDRKTGSIATRVELEVCTSLPFEVCKARIDPHHWCDCNPYFVSVVDNPPCTKVGIADWFGAVLEDVGPGLNLEYYTTDLGIRYVEQARMAAVAFDLATFPSGGAPRGDGRVSVDRGFLSLTDEGTHRRVRMVKVYRIEHLDVPQSWVCPLWASQVALSGWWCSKTDVFRRLLRAWTVLTKDVIVATEAFCASAHSPDRTVPRGGSGARPALTPDDSTMIVFTKDLRSPNANAGVGRVRVPVPGRLAKTPFAPVRASRAAPERPDLVSVNATIEADVDHPDFVVVSLPDPMTQSPGLYVGHVDTAGGEVIAPFAIYLDRP